MRYQLLISLSLLTIAPYASAQRVPYSTPRTVLSLNAGMLSPLTEETTYWGARSFRHFDYPQTWSAGLGLTRTVYRGLAVGARVNYGSAATTDVAIPGLFIRSRKSILEAGPTVSYTLSRGPWLIVPECTPAVAVGFHRVGEGVPGGELQEPGGPDRPALQDLRYHLDSRSVGLGVTPALTVARRIRGSLALMGRAAWRSAVGGNAARPVTVYYEGDSAEYPLGQVRGEVDDRPLQFLTYSVGFLYNL